MAWALMAWRACERHRQRRWREGKGLRKGRRGAFAEEASRPCDVWPVNTEAAVVMTKAATEEWNDVSYVLLPAPKEGGVLSV